jgi:hypothetical protein
METIEQRAKNVIANGKPFDGQEAYEKFRQANEHHEELIKRGVTSRRGYCLRTVCDAPAFRYDKNLT